MKRIIAIALVVMMIAALGIASSAANTTGKITITNAEIGKTYDIYKIFDATYTTFMDEDGVTHKSVSYTTSDPTVIAAIQADEDKALTDNSVCPFVLQGTGDNGTYYVVHKDQSAIDLGRGWIKNHIDLFGDPVDSKTCEEGNTVVFDLPYGYYLIQPGEGAVATVNTNTPNVCVVDKNPTGPKEPEKTEDKVEVKVGDVVTYTAKFDATNFYVTNGSNVNQIEDYIITDSYQGLSYDGTIESAKWYTYDEDGDVIDSGDIAGVTYTAKTAPEGYDGAGEFFIPWVEYTYKQVEDDQGQLVNTDEVASMKSLYPSPCTVEITYKMTVTDDIFGNPTPLEGVNKIKVSYEYDKHSDSPKKPDIPGEPEVKVYTTALSVRKVDSTDDTKLLEGAEFVLYKLDEDDNPLYYAIDADKNVTWEADLDDATVKIADNKYETMEFEGLTSGTYYLLETKAPEGYVAPDDPWDVVVTFDNDSKTFTCTFDGEEVDLNNFGYYTLIVANAGSNPLPATGGTGTILFIVIGSIVFAATAIVLVTKKRMYNEG